MKLNNKGFSMIEILAVVVILGVISTVGIVSVSRLLEKSKEHYYVTQRDQMVLAARAYAGDHKEILPKDIGHKEKISLKTLYEKNYLKDKIEDKNKGKCYDEPTTENGKEIKGSRVEVTKTSQNEYVYVGYLECDACKEEKGDNKVSCYDDTKEKGPHILIEPDEINGNNLLNKDNIIKITLYGMNSESPDYDPNIMVASYSYKIYVNGQLKKNSGLKVNNKKNKIVLDSEKLYQYVPGKVKIVVSTTNSDGITTTKAKTVDYSDVTIPLCAQVSYDGNNQMTSYPSKDTENKVCGTEDYKWIKIGSTPVTRHVWVQCDDELGLGCAQTEFSKLLETDGYTDEVKIKDNSDKNEEISCQVMKCIDRLSPKITVNIKSGNTTKKTYTVPAQRTSNPNKPTDKYDTWLNLENYPNGVTVEVIVNDGEKNKEDSSLIKNFSWYQNEKEKKESQVNHNTPTNSKFYDEKDKGNKNACKGIANRKKLDCKEYKYSKTIKEDGVRRERIIVEDYAGNNVEYSLILKIDRTPPTVPTTNLKKWKNNSTRPTSSAGLSNYSNNTWYNGKVFTYPSGSVDSPDVSGLKEYRYKTTGKTTNNTNTVATYRNVEAEGVSYIYWRSCDNANNCSNYNAAKTIKLDRTNPTCSVRNSGGSPGNNGWYKGGTVTATGYCSDQSGLSGCKVSSQFIQSISSNTSGTTKSITLYDNANNSVKCTSTIKYDSSRPACSISKSNLNQPEGVTLSTSCWDNGPSGVGSCTGTRYGIKSSQTNYVTDNAGNGNSCSINVYSKSQRRTCTTCSSCAAAGCALYKRCTNIACGSTKTYHRTCDNCWCTPVGDAAAGGYDGGPCDNTSTYGTPHGCCHQYCECGTDYYDWVSVYVHTCRTAACGCQTYKTSCPSCGCSSWGGWYDSSCSSSSSVQCRTVYY